MLVESRRSYEQFSRPALRHRAVAGHISQDQTLEHNRLASCPMEAQTGALRGGFSPPDIRYSQHWHPELPASVARQGLMPGNFLLTSVASVLKLQKAPRPMMPWGWYQRCSSCWSIKLCVFTSCKEDLGSEQTGQEEGSWGTPRGEGSTGHALLPGHRSEGLEVTPSGPPDSHHWGLSAGDLKVTIGLRVPGKGVRHFLIPCFSSQTHQVLLVHSASLLPLPLGQPPHHSQSDGSKSPAKFPPSPDKGCPAPKRV